MELSWQNVFVKVMRASHLSYSTILVGILDKVDGRTFW